MDRNKLFLSQMEALLAGDDWQITSLSNAAALLKESVEDINWAGFYVVKEHELALGPFQGKLACTHIALGKGVCGTAALENKTQMVADIRQFAGYIACDGETRSEIVVPLHDKTGSVIGVLDIDSKTEGRFSEDDRVLLEAAARIIEKAISEK